MTKKNTKKKVDPRGNPRKTKTVKKRITRDELNRARMLKAKRKGY